MSKESKSYKNSPKKVYIRTFGCQMNQADSAALSRRLQEAGFQTAESPETADVVIFNTCCVRQHAEERLFQNITALRRLKEERPFLLGLVGCVPAFYGERLRSVYPFVDFMASPTEIEQVPVLITACLKNRRLPTPHPRLSPPPDNERISAFLPVITGCDNFCSYCVVPYTRGPERSRSVEEILREAERLVREGVKELILLGQNVNSYQDGERRFPALLPLVANLFGLLRLGFLTSHPKDASLELFAAMASLPNLYRHLHLPLQSGSDRILAAMNRGYTAGDYLRLVAEARRLIPDLSVTTDIIVGFPGEEEQDFAETLAVLKEVEFDNLYAFKYSDRPKTAAVAIEPKVSEEVKEERLARLWQIQEAISLRKNQALVGKEVETLILRQSRKKAGYWVGKTLEAKKVLVKAESAVTAGCLVPVLIDAADQRLLFGVVGVERRRPLLSRQKKPPDEDGLFLKPGSAGCPAEAGAPLRRGGRYRCAGDSSCKRCR